MNCTPNIGHTKLVCYNILKGVLFIWEDQKAEKTSIIHQNLN